MDAANRAEIGDLVGHKFLENAINMKQEWITERNNRLVWDTGDASNKNHVTKSWRGTNLNILSWENSAFKPKQGHKQTSLQIWKCDWVVRVWRLTQRKWWTRENLLVLIYYIRRWADQWKQLFDSVTYRYAFSWMLLIARSSYPVCYEVWLPAPSTLPWILLQATSMH